MNILCYSGRKKWQIHCKLTSGNKNFVVFFVNSETSVLNSNNSTEKKTHPLPLLTRALIQRGILLTKSTNPAEQSVLIFKKDKPSDNKITCMEKYHKNKATTKSTIHRIVQPTASHTWHLSYL